jgi:hypothetical protein
MLLMLNLHVQQKLMLSSNFKSYQIHYFERYDFGYTVVLFKLDVDVQQKLLLCSCFRLTKFIIVIDMILVTLCCAT